MIKNYNITEKVKQLIYKNSKSWLCEKLGCEARTLNRRIEKGNWSKLEIQAIINLIK